MIKIKIYETRTTYSGGIPMNEKEDVLVHSVESDDKVVLASFLRGVATSYDPPKPHTR